MDTQKKTDKWTDGHPEKKQTNGQMDRQTDSLTHQQIEGGTN